MNYSYDQLYQFTFRCFAKSVVPKIRQRLQQKFCFRQNLRGVDSHGVARLSGYVRLLEKGRINATPNIRVVYETPSTAVVDGDGGLGLIVAPFAMQVAIEKAKIAGTGWVSVKHSNHYGIAGYHAHDGLGA